MYPVNGYLDSNNANLRESESPFSARFYRINPLALSVQSRWSSEPCLPLPVLSHVSFPAVSASKPTVEELVALFSESLEADETEVLSRNNGLLTFAANVDCPEFHGSLLALLALLVNRFISQLSRSLSAFCRRARDVSMDLHSVDDSADLDDELIPRDVQSYRP